MTFRVEVRTPPQSVFDQLKGASREAMDVAMQRYSFDSAAVVLEAIQKSLAAPRLTELRRSWRIAKPAKVEGGWVAYVFSDHPRAGFRETGGTVKAGVNAAKCGPNAGGKTKALAIPLPAAKTSTSTKRPCEIAGLRWIPNRRALRGNPNNRGVLAQVGPKGKIQKVFFALKQQVTVRPFPYAQPAVDSTEEKRFVMFEHYAKKALGL